MAPKIDYNKNKEILQNFYIQNSIFDFFERDDAYIAQAFNEITDIWFTNLEQIKKIKYLMISEAPLWGEKRSYIYNPDSPNAMKLVYFGRN